MVLHHRQNVSQATAARRIVAYEFRRRLGQILRDLADSGAPLNQLQRLSGLGRRELTELIAAVRTLERP